MKLIKAYMNWSGGKDSSLCLYKVLQSGEIDIKYLLTSTNNIYHRISMHGVRIVILEKQAESIGIPLQLIKLSELPGMEEYERETKKQVQKIKKEGIKHAIFGDIFLEDLRTYREVK